MIVREDLLAYLVVLNHEPVLKKLSDEQKKIGNAHMMGCLFKVMDQIEDGSYLRTAIQNREHLNGIHPVGQPQLAEATAEVSELLYAYMIGEDRLTERHASHSG